MRGERALSSYYVSVAAGSCGQRRIDNRLWEGLKKPERVLASNMP